MLCYRDKTFCTFHKECCKGAVCNTALTEQVKEDAFNWWGNEDAPIAVFIDKPECFEDREKVLDELTAIAQEDGQYK